MKSSKNVLIAFALNFTFAMIEFICGLLFHSSAVLADAVHDTGDALAIGLSAFFEKISNRKEDEHYTLGYKRYSLLAALLTSVILLLGSFWILFENIPKFFAPEKVNNDGMLILGIVAIIVNLLAGKAISRGQTRNESILSLHFLEDILGWFAIILVSVILRFTDWYFLDPLLSLLISIFILSQALPKFWETIKIFLDHVPSDLTLADLEAAINRLPHVKTVTQLNVWTTDGLEKCAMIHICVENTQELRQTKKAVHQLVRSYGIVRSTVECDESLEEHLEHGIAASSQNEI